MTKPPPALLSAPTERLRSQSNRWEIALWIFGVVLIVLGLAAGVGLALIVVARNNTNFDQIDVAQETWIQVFELISPAFVTGGVISVALAIFSRVLDTNARRRDLTAHQGAGAAAREVQPEPEPEPEPQQEPGPARDAQLAMRSDETPQATSASTPVDLSRYMRPTDDGTTSPE